MPMFTYSKSPCFDLSPLKAMDLCYTCVRCCLKHFIVLLVVEVEVRKVLQGVIEKK